MIGVALACAVLAVLLGVPPPASQGLHDRLAPLRPSGRRPGRRWLRIGLPSALALVVLVGGVALGGGRGGVLAAVGVITAGVTVWLVRGRGRSRRALRAQVEVARGCQLLASHLRVGQVPTEALAMASTDCAVLMRARQVHGVGGDLTAVWRSQGRLPGHGGLLELARAWQVSVQTGAPLSANLEQVAASLSAEESLRAVVASELASPRATSKVMAVLPACGIGLGYLLGGDPIGWLLGGPAGWGCLIGGMLLAAAGVIWIERLADEVSVAR